MTRDQQYTVGFLLMALGTVLLLAWGISGAYGNGQTLAGMITFAAGITQLIEARKKPRDE